MMISIGSGAGLKLTYSDLEILQRAGFYLLRPHRGVVYRPLFPKVYRAPPPKLVVYFNFPSAREAAI